MKPHRGVLILVLAIVGFVTSLWIPLGTIAWILGNIDLKEMDAGRMDPEGRSMTQIGKIIGMVLTILAIVGLLIGCIVIIVFFVFGAALWGAASYEMHQEMQKQMEEMQNFKNGMPNVDLIMPFWYMIAG